MNIKVERRLSYEESSLVSHGKKLSRKKLFLRQFEYHTVLLFLYVTFVAL